ncbi:unnamed protein product [Umbelopsis sp. WA50703]
MLWGIDVLVVALDVVDHVSPVLDVDLRDSLSRAGVSTNRCNSVARKPFSVRMIAALFGRRLIHASAPIELIASSSSCKRTINLGDKSSASFVNEPESKNALAFDDKEV